MGSLTSLVDFPNFGESVMPLSVQIKDAIQEALSEPTPPQCPSEALRESLRVSECADLLLKDVSGIDRKRAMARVSWAAGKEKFRTNGAKGNARRIDRDSFNTWRLEQRERDLDAVE